MASFTVRVELHKADSEDYENLHEKMKAKGYNREIVDSAGKKYKLPSAEYTATKNMTSSQVVNEVVEIAAKVKPNPDVLVTKSDGRAWQLTQL
ncbi:type V toxin-antitoxin system endoribonuclease antitoxin GhoS [Serratia liquefaciens]|uniref:type V toxin-antitoxin system endoribonuclease antitoxin GhoS n=1 Tax=Serratia liquefaciens TaxID=614 RepID=UPI0018D713E6|nr:type V toxin-antitoxin system endoribonuclease antitoxin GhoS [Serratia liquefaciens]MBH2810150.1 type V toxin-antitoxin system endoribonuclease antitoxin GhoS [Serratia liquefaciens]